MSLTPNASVSETAPNPGMTPVASLRSMLQPQNRNSSQSCSGLLTELNSIALTKEAQ